MKWLVLAFGLILSWDYGCEATYHAGSYWKAASSKVGQASALKPPAVKKAPERRKSFADVNPSDRELIVKGTMKAISLKNTKKSVDDCADIPPPVDRDITAEECDRIIKLTDELIRISKILKEKKKHVKASLLQPFMNQVGTSTSHFILKGVAIRLITRAEDKVMAGCRIMEFMSDVVDSNSSPVPILEFISDFLFQLIDQATSNAILKSRNPTVQEQVISTHPCGHRRNKDYKKNLKEGKAFMKGFNAADPSLACPPNTKHSLYCAKKYRVLPCLASTRSPDGFHYCHPSTTFAEFADAAPSPLSCIGKGISRPDVCPGIACAVYVRCKDRRGHGCVIDTARWIKGKKGMRSLGYFGESHDLEVKGRTKGTSIWICQMPSVPKADKELKTWVAKCEERQDCPPPPPDPDEVERRRRAARPSKAGGRRVHFE